MMTDLSQSIRLPRLTKTKCVSMFAVSALLLTAIFLRADSDGNQSERSLTGTWISDDGGNLVSFMSDGRQIGTIPINIPTHNGPGGGNELAAPAQGEWVRTGNREFVSTAFSQLSSPDSLIGFTHLVKLTANYTLNKAADEITLTNPMIAVYLLDGTLQFPPFPGAVTHFKRVVAGQ